MKSIIKIQTADGTLHSDRKSATHYLDQKYGNLLSSIVHRLLRDGNCKYAESMDWIDSNLDDFQALLKIKADMKMENADDDQE